MPAVGKGVFIPCPGVDIWECDNPSRDLPEEEDKKETCLRGAAKAAGIFCVVSMVGSKIRFKMTKMGN